MENSKISFHYKKELLKLLQKLGMDNLVDSVRFTSMTTLRLEGVFGMYNIKYIVSSPLVFDFQIGFRLRFDISVGSTVKIKEGDKL